MNLGHRYSFCAKLMWGQRTSMRHIVYWCILVLGVFNSVFDLCICIFIVLFKSAFNILSDVNDKTDEIMTL